LYYRLNVFPLHIAPLRERRADIVPLARLFAERHAEQLARPLRLSEQAERLLLEYAWPGNVRELENAVERAAIIASGNSIEPEQLEICLTEPAPQPIAQREEACAAGAMLDMKSLERAHIMETLLAVNGSRKLAVQRLGISERTLRYKIAQYRMSGAA
jgi:two-component system response regulator FlrC